MRLQRLTSTFGPSTASKRILPGRNDPQARPWSRPVLASALLWFGGSTLGTAWLLGIYTHVFAATSSPAMIWLPLVVLSFLVSPVTSLLIFVGHHLWIDFRRRGGPNESAFSGVIFFFLWCGCLLLSVLAAMVGYSVFVLGGLG